MPTPTSGGTFSIIDPSGNSTIDALIDGVRWGPRPIVSPVTVTYSFPTAESIWSTDYSAGYGPSDGSGEPWNGFMPLTASEQAQVRQILQMIASFANVQFSEIAETSLTVGDVRFGFSSSVDPNAAAQAYLPGGTYSVNTLQGSADPYAGDVWINAFDYAVFSPTPGSYDYMVLIHEIGHALGLKHPFEVDGAFGALPTNQDYYENTVMSYSAIAGDQSSAMSYYPTTFMADDVAALQNLYGANMSYHTGNDTYTFREGQNYNQILWDAGGTDTLVYESTTAGAVIDLHPGQWQALGVPLNYWDGGNGANDYSSKYTVQILPGVSIENATGGNGADSITGNDANNLLMGRGGNDTLSGGAGNDVLNGGAGADSMTGGDGSDTYYVDNVGDIVSETNAATAIGGSDTVLCSLTTAQIAAYQLPANVENLRILTSGSANGTANDLNNVIYAGAGNNVLDGGNGVDTLSYAFGLTAGAVSGVTVSLATALAQNTGSSGSDTISNFENLTGSSLNDRLTGNAGANVLDGGQGADTLLGGLGNDTYLVDNAGDVVTETANAGTDLVKSYLASYTLPAYVENLQLMGSANLNGTGNGLNNILTGNAGNNVLNGDAGIDTASYAAAANGVTVDLNLSTQQNTIGAGSDTLISIENLTGSSHNDTLIGNSAANILVGGLGNDTLTGGGGADIFVFNAALDAGTNLDTITDFISGIDKIRLNHAIFSAIPATGDFSNGDPRFYAAAGATAGHDADDRVIYNTQTGALYYDADGSGSGTAVEFAILGTSTHPSLAATDLTVV